MNQRDELAIFLRRLIALPYFAFLLLFAFTVAREMNVKAAGVSVFFGPSAAGGDTGADCTNAHVYSNNTAWAANEGSDNINWLCPGTYSVAANGIVQQVSSGGTSGHPFTVECVAGSASSVNLTAPYFNDGAALRVDSTSWVVLDGNGSCIVQNTANGTGLANQQPSTGITVNASTNVTVKNFTVANICQHTSTADTTGCQQSGSADQSIGIVGGATNVTITGNTIHDSTTGIVYGVQPGDSGGLISSNTISRTNWAINATLQSAGTSTGPEITLNYIICVAGAPCNWDDVGGGGCSGGCFHHNGIFMFPQNGATMNGVKIHDNQIGDINGNTTAYIYLDPAGTGNVPSCQIYNGIFFTTAGQSGPSNGMITSGAGVSGCLIANNTMVGPGTRGFGGDISTTMQNNIADGETFVEYFDSGATGNVADHNDFFAWGTGWFNGSSPFSTLATWISGTGSQCSGGCDATGSINNDPNLTASFVPNAGSPVIATGVNLSGLGITGLGQDAPQTVGVAGSCGTGCKARGTNWTMGARNGASTTPATPAPTGKAIASATFKNFGTGPMVQPPPPPPISQPGNWQGLYGIDGHSIEAGTQKIPSYATVSVKNESLWTWATGTPDVRGLLDGTSRIAACWYGQQYSIDVNFTDGNSHPFTLYMVDWDLRGRAETIQIVDAVTGKQLDSRKISNFAAGEYATWNISGHVTVNVTCNSGVNAVVSGMFFN